MIRRKPAVRAAKPSHVTRDLERPHPIGEPCIRQLAHDWAAAEAGGWRLDHQLAP